MGNFPNRATQFPVNRQDHTKKGPYLTPILNKLLSAEWPIKDAKMKSLLKRLELPETIAVSVALRRILNACEGDDLAIERIFDRVDGKVANIQEEGTDDLINNTLEFKDIPKNGKGLHRFAKFIHR